LLSRKSCSIAEALLLIAHVTTAHTNVSSFSSCIRIVVNTCARGLNKRQGLVGVPVWHNAPFYML